MMVGLLAVIAVPVVLVPTFVIVVILDICGASHAACGYIWGGVLLVAAMCVMTAVYQFGKALVMALRAKDE